MENNKLIGMVDFVLLNAIETPTIETEEYDWYYAEQKKLDIVRRYAKFLKQPLTLSMFIPISEAGEVLEEPDVRCLRDGNCQCGEEQVSDCREWKHEYQKAKDKIIFEGFECNGEEVIETHTGMVLFERDFTSWFKCEDDIETIEDLFIYGLTLTPNALKLI